MITLIYDDTWNGFLTAVFEAFAAKEPCLLQNARRGGVGSLLPPKTVHEDDEKAARVLRGIDNLPHQKPSHSAPTEPDRSFSEALYSAWLSELPGIEDSIVACLRLGFQRQCDPLPLRQIDCAHRVNTAAKKANWEAHRFIQFVRFIEGGENLYMANIQPECDVLPLLAEHFHDRYKILRFIIQDTVRRKAIFSDPTGWVIVEMEDQLLELPKGGEFEKLWKTYFDTIANPARRNKKLQQKFVPLRFREHLTEFQ